MDQDFMQVNIIASHICFGGQKWMLTVKLVYKLSNVPDDLKWAKNTHMTPFIPTFKEGITNDIYGFGRLFLLLLLRPPVFVAVHPYLYPSIFVLPVQMTGGRAST